MPTDDAPVGEKASVGGPGELAVAVLDTPRDDAPPTPTPPFSGEPETLLARVERLLHQDVSL